MLTVRRFVRLPDGQAITLRDENHKSLGAIRRLSPWGGPTEIEELCYLNCLRPDHVSRWLLISRWENPQGEPCSPAYAAKGDLISAQAAIEWCACYLGYIPDELEAEALFVQPDWVVPVRPQEEREHTVYYEVDFPSVDVEEPPAPEAPQTPEEELRRFAKEQLKGHQQLLLLQLLDSPQHNLPFLTWFALAKYLPEQAARVKPPQELLLRYSGRAKSLRNRVQKQMEEAKLPWYIAEEGNDTFVLEPRPVADQSVPEKYLQNIPTPYPTPLVGFSSGVPSEEGNNGTQAAGLQPPGTDSPCGDPPGRGAAKRGQPGATSDLAPSR